MDGIVQVGSVPLHRAAGRGCLDMCKLLIDAGANIDVLVNAVFCQQKEVTEMEAKNSEIVCPVSGKIIWKHVCGASGDVSRYKTEFDEIKVIGVGGYACVFECSNKLDGKHYAIKKMNLQELEMDFDYLVREVLAMAVMNHPNIVRYYSAWVEREIAGGFFEAGEERGSYEEVECTGPVLYIQQELCSSSLSELLIGGGLDDKTVWNIFKDIVFGLHHIHEKGVRHGDLSPNNVFFDEDKNAKIGDFGLASLIESGVFGPNSPRAMGFYCAPEIDEGNYSLASDIYSLGIILLEMFARYTIHMEKARVKENPELISLDDDDNKEKMELILRLTDPDPDPSLRPNTRFIIELKFISNAI